jgi:hypothetical protein
MAGLSSVHVTAHNWHVMSRLILIHATAQTRLRRINKFKWAEALFYLPRQLGEKQTKSSTPRGGKPKRIKLL